MALFSSLFDYFLGRDNHRAGEEEEKVEAPSEENEQSEEEDVEYFKEVNRKLREDLEKDSDEELNEEEVKEYQQVLKERLHRATQILHDINHYPTQRLAKENALKRLNSLLESEMSFIKKMDQGTLKLSPARIKSTNLAHLQAILYTLYHPNIADVCDTRHPILSKTEGSGKQKLTVDVVCCNSSVWISIVARNAKHLQWSSESYGSRSGLKRKTLELLQFGMQQSPRPSIILCLPYDIHHYVVDKLASRFSALEIWAHPPFIQCGNDYKGRYFSIGYPDDCDPAIHLEKLHTSFNATREDQSPIQYVNLDTSTLVALSSDVCNGKMRGIFRNGEEHIIQLFGQGGYSFLATQAKEEADDPVVPSVLHILHSRTPVVTRKAKLHFENILSLIGTESEKEKAKEIMERVQVMEEMEEFKEVRISERVERLPASKTVNEMQKEVFGKADSIPNMITSTSNRGFVRAASQANVHLRVAFHGSRALLTKKYESLTLPSPPL